MQRYQFESEGRQENDAIKKVALYCSVRESWTLVLTGHLSQHQLNILKYQLTIICIISVYFPAKYNVIVYSLSHTQYASYLFIFYSCNQPHCQVIYIRANAMSQLLLTEWTAVHSAQTLGV